jgi:hypothetical protein
LTGESSLLLAMSSSVANRASLSNHCGRFEPEKMPVVQLVLPRQLVFYGGAADPKGELIG